MGSVYDGTLIVGGRSEDGNFDFIDQLDAGEELTFTDMTGRVFRYTVRKFATLIMPEPKPWLTQRARLPCL